MHLRGQTGLFLTPCCFNNYYENSNQHNYSDKYSSAEFSSKEKFDTHYQEHGKEFGDITQQEYLNSARSFFNSSNKDVETFMTDQGWIFKYNYATNEFGIISPWETISTYYLPEKGVDYWYEQLDKYFYK